MVPDKNNDNKCAYCDLKDEEGKHLTFIDATIISEEPAEKKFICSWDTGRFSAQAYYRLQVWVSCNISGKTDEDDMLIIEALLASEELIRYIKT